MSKVIHTAEDGVIERMEYNWKDDTATVKTTQDVQPVIDYNKARQNDGTHGWTPQRTMRQVAELTPLMQLELDEKFRHKMRPGTHIWNKENRPLLRAILQDPDYRWLRVD